MVQERHDPLFRFLDLNGDGSGVKNAIGNYATATPFFITPDAIEQRFIIHRVMTYIEDAETGITLATYGGDTALGTGIQLQVVRRYGQTFDLYDGSTVKSNADWARICYDVDISTFPAGNNYVHARWTFSRSGAPIVLNYGDKLQFVMNDNLTALITHSFLIQGYIE